MFTRIYKKYGKYIDECTLRRRIEIVVKISEFHVHPNFSIDNYQIEYLVFFTVRKKKKLLSKENITLFYIHNGSSGTTH